MRPCFNCERFDPNCEKPFDWFETGLRNYIGGCAGKGVQYDYGNPEEYECDIFKRKESAHG